MHLDEVKKLIRPHPDFPKKGILFQDIFPVFAVPSAVQSVIDALVEAVRREHDHVDVVLGLDARGFLFGPQLAAALGCAFAPIRKKGKLPGKTLEVAYEKEYGTDWFEMQCDAVKPGATCIVVDDLLATGGSATAALLLIQKAQARPAGFYFLIELDGLSGRDRVATVSEGAPVHALFHF